MRLETGDIEGAEEALREIEEVGDSDSQDESNTSIGRIGVLNAKGEHREAVAEARRLLDGPGAHFLFNAPDRLSAAADSAFELGDLEAARHVRERVAEIAAASDRLAAAFGRFVDARLAAADMASDSEASWGDAIAVYDDLGVPIIAAEARLAYARWLADAGSPNEAVEVVERAIGAMARVGARRLPQAIALRDRLGPLAVSATTRSADGDTHGV